MKRIFLILSLFAVMANLYATDVISVIRQKGWLETAMMQWTHLLRMRDFQRFKMGLNQRPPD